MAKVEETEFHFKTWSDFFKRIPFTFFRTSQIQKKYIQTILDYSPKNGGKLLEIAGGSGYTAAVVADLVRNDGITVHYSDLDLTLIETVEKKFKSIDNLNFDVADAFNTFYVNDAFDLVFSQGFLEHFSDEDIVKLLKEQSRIAKCIVFDIPNSRRWSKVREFGNERFLSHSKWISLAKEAGLVVHHQTARRFTNFWKKLVPVFIQESEWFHRNFGEASIIVCGREHT